MGLLTKIDFDGVCCRVHAITTDDAWFSLCFELKERFSFEKIGTCLSDGVLSAKATDLVKAANKLLQEQKTLFNLNIDFAAITKAGATKEYSENYIETDDNYGLHVGDTVGIFIQTDEPMYFVCQIMPFMKLGTTRADAKDYCGEIFSSLPKLTRVLNDLIFELNELCSWVNV